MEQNAAIYADFYVICSVRQTAVEETHFVRALRSCSHLLIHHTLDIYSPVQRAWPRPRHQLSATSGHAMMIVSSADLFVFAQERTILVRLPSFEWSSTLGLLVRLQVGEQTVDGRQVGTGNHAGRPAILLSPTGDWAEAISAVEACIASGGTAVVSEIE